MEHLLPQHFLTRPINVEVVGCGGTGSQIMSGLARLHFTMRELGHPFGLKVRVWDDDIVESHNVGRQLFLRPDVGRYKGDVMVHRLNLAYGLDWSARSMRFDGRAHGDNGLIVGCVDTKSSRKAILQSVQECSECYWLDMGNRSKDGQVLLGMGGRRAAAHPVRLPLPTELLPELIEGDEDLETPTCSVQASVARQGLFLNQQVATWGLEILFRLFTRGRLDWHGVFINTESASVTKIKVDTATWERFGFQPLVTDELKKAA